MALKESNRLRVQRIAARLAARQTSATDVSGRAAFEAAFVRHRDDVIIPLLRDLGVELAQAGHAFTIEPDGDPRRPSVLFRVDLRDGTKGNANVIGFFVQHDGPAAKSEVTAYLALKSEFELDRFYALSELTRDVLEQMIVDGLEHMLASNG